MRVLILISSSGFYGAEAAVANLAAGLLRLDCEPVIGSLQNPTHPRNGFEEQLVSLGLPVVAVPCRGRLDRRTLSWIRNYIRESSVDVVHTNGYKADVYGYWAARTTGAAVVATCHNWTNEGLRGRFYDFLDRLVLRRFPVLAAVSDPVRQSLRRFGLPGDRIRVILNGVDMCRFQGGNGRASHTATIGFVGRLSPEKGVDVLLHSVRGVLETQPDARFLIVGDGPARRDLELLAGSLGVAGHVQFEGRRSDIEAVYASLDVVVLPSRNEGAPMTVLESMAAGRPIVATRVGAIPEMVAEGQTGVLVEPDNPTALAAAVGSLLSDPVRRLSMGLRARQLAVTRFSCEAMARQYLDLYQSAARQGAAC